jgi:hypothetical protein
VYRQNHPRHSLGTVRLSTQIFLYAFISQNAEIAEQVAILLKITPQHDGHRKDIVTVWHRGYNAARDKLSSGQYLLLVARRTKSSTLAREGSQNFMFALITADSRKTTRQIATRLEFLHHFRDNRTQEAVALLVSVRVNF